MVNDSGQLYTMEGVAAGLIMILTAYIVLTTVSIYTPGDTHITDMQLEQLGSDVLAVMDTRINSGEVQSDLARFISQNKGAEFKNQFLQYCNATTDGAVLDNLKMHANVIYRETAGHALGEYEVKSYILCDPDPSFTGRESAVRVTRWVYLGNVRPAGVDPRPQIVLLEVLLWR